MEARQGATASASAADQVIVITRVLDAPRELVWKAWTDPEHLMRWWGPTGFTAPVSKIDLRPGGVWHNCMRSPEGQDFWSKGVYREVVAPERLVTTDSFADAAGNPVPPTAYGMSAAWPQEALLTVTFTEHGGKTTLALHHAVPGAPQSERDMCAQGWGQSMDRLAEYLREAQRSGGHRS